MLRTARFPVAPRRRRLGLGPPLVALRRRPRPPPLLPTATARATSASRRLGRVARALSNVLVRVKDLEVLDGLEGFEHGLQLGHDVQLGGVPVVLDERPELLQAVELTRVSVADALLLEVLVELWAELALEAVAVEAEEALEAVAVSGLGVLDGERAELLVHLAVEVLAEEERPEPEHGVHLLRVTHAQLLALL